MHEMSIAMNVVEIATSQALQNEAQRINSITMEIGSLAGVLVDSLEFCFAAAAKGTPADGARLIIEKIQACGSCRECKTEFEVESYLTVCPGCGAFKVDYLAGQELRIKSLNVD